MDILGNNSVTHFSKDHECLESNSKILQPFKQIMNQQKMRNGPMQMRKLCSEESNYSEYWGSLFAFLEQKLFAEKVVAEFKCLQHIYLQKNFPVLQKILLHINMLSFLSCRNPVMKFHQLRRWNRLLWEQSIKNYPRLARKNAGKKNFIRVIILLKHCLAITLVLFFCAISCERHIQIIRWCIFWYCVKKGVSRITWPTFLNLWFFVLISIYADPSKWTIRI